MNAERGVSTKIRNNAAYIAVWHALPCFGCATTATSDARASLSMKSYEEIFFLSAASWIAFFLAFEGGKEANSSRCCCWAFSLSASSISFNVPRTLRRKGKKSSTAKHKSKIHSGPTRCYHSLVKVDKFNFDCIRKTSWTADVKRWGATASPLGFPPHPKAERETFVHLVFPPSRERVNKLFQRYVHASWGVENFFLNYLLGFYLFEIEFLLVMLSAGAF